MYLESGPDGQDGRIENDSLFKLGVRPSKWIANYATAYIASVFGKYIDNENFGPFVSGWALFTLFISK